MTNEEVSKTEINNFKDFINQYANELGAATSVVGELINDNFINKLLQMAKKYNWEQLSSVNTGSLAGLATQNNLLLMRNLTR